MSIAAAFLALIAAPESLLAGTPPRQIGGSINNDDYPAIAIAGEHQGTSEIRFLVTAGGQAKQCATVRGSGSDVLDATACALAVQRFRFVPARDESGRARAQEVTRRIRWVLPTDSGTIHADAPPEQGGTAARQIGGAIAMTDYPHAAIEAGESGRTRVFFSVGTDGRAGDCTIAESSGSAVLDSTSCALVINRFRFDPARDRSGRPARSYITRRISWVLPVVPATPVARWQPGEQRFSIGFQDGRVLCAIETTGAAFEPMVDLACPQDGRVPLAEIARSQMPLTTITRFRPDGARLVAGTAEVHGRLIGRAAYEVDVDRAGTITACRAVAAEAPAMPDGVPNICDGPRDAPAFERGDTAAPRRGRVEIEIYRLGEGVT